MLQAERHKLICSYICQKGAALVSELSKLCSVSQETIRRDLTVLENDNKLMRSFGGAIAISQENTPTINISSSVKLSQLIDGKESFRRKTEEGSEYKIKMAKAALEFIHPGDSIMLDNSSSCWFLARELPDIAITVITNSVKIIQSLACRDRVQVIGIGGEYSERYDDFHGPIAESMIRTFQVKTLFFSCQGFSVEKGIRDGSDVNAKLKSSMLQVAENKVLLADESKLDELSLSQICTFNDVNVLITNKLNDKRFYDEFTDLTIIECEN